jgi:hypothetical protein
VLDPADRWRRLRRHDGRRGVGEPGKSTYCGQGRVAGAGDLCIVASGNREGRAASCRRLRAGAGKGWRTRRAAGCRFVSAGWYALLELADRGNSTPAPRCSFMMVAERPLNVVRSVTRLFTSDAEDKPWYNDREMWRGTSRCSRAASIASI